MNELRRQTSLNRRSLFQQMSALLVVNALWPSHHLVAQESFQQWLLNFKRYAQSQGIKPATLERAFGSVKRVNPSVLKRANYQPEFNSHTFVYIDNLVTNDAAKRGQAYEKKWAQPFRIIEQRYGVPAPILLAIWSIESSFGSVLEQPHRLFDLFDALASLGYGNSRRRQFARQQLLAALKILQNTPVNRALMRSSWAGALGHTQFIPTSYLAYARDFDGDGFANIWQNPLDSLASSANLLHQNGWVRGQHWGYEAIVPAKLHGWGQKTLAQWREAGARILYPQTIKDWQQKASLLLLDGSKGPAFLVLHNFQVIKRYNNANRYALAVGLLSDKIAGINPMQGQWLRSYRSLSLDERRYVQHILKQLNLYHDNIDGMIGPNSVKAIRAFQRQQKLAITGLPDKDLYEAVARVAKARGLK